MLKDLVHKSRSYRGYDHSVKVSREELLKLVELTRFCPSTMNCQALKFHISYQEDEVRLVQEQTGWAAALKDVSLPLPGTEPTAFITICIDKSISTSRFLQHDVGIAAQTMLLQATEDGLGGIIIGNLKRDRLREILKLGPELEIAVVVAIGKPQEDISIVEMESGDSFTYYRDETKTHHYVPKRKLDEILI